MFLNVMKKVIRAGNPNYNQFMFTWMLTNWCNYKCSYCCEKPRLLHDWAKEDSISTYRLTLAKLKRFDKPFQIELYGGEPTLHPNLLEILHTLKLIENCKDIYVITNLSRPIEYFRKLNVPELSGIYIMASFHAEYFDQTFVEKVKAINDMEHLRVRVTINLTDEQQHWENIINLIDQLSEHSIDYGLHFLNDTDTWKSNYTDDFFNLFRPLQKISYRDKSVHLYNYEFDDGSNQDLNDLEVYENQYHKFTGYTCTPRFYEIDLDGTFRNICTRAEFNSPIINSSKIEKTVSCPLNNCPCEIMFNTFKELKL